MPQGDSLTEAGNLITLPELLEDKRYRQFFSTVPKQGPSRANWRIFVQRKPDGPWAKRDYDKYSDAFRRIARELKGGTLHDGTIQSRGIAYAPPERIVRVTKNGRPVMARNSRGELVQKTAVVAWKPKLDADEEPHTWCSYCRRPMVFRWFASHHSLRNSPVAGCIDPTDRRCVICGGREEFIRETLKSAARPGYAVVATGTRRKVRR